MPVPLPASIVSPNSYDTSPNHAVPIGAAAVSQSAPPVATSSSSSSSASASHSIPHHVPTLMSLESSSDSVLRSPAATAFDDLQSTSHDALLNATEALTATLSTRSPHAAPAAPSSNTAAYPSSSSAVPSLYTTPNLNVPQRESILHAPPVLAQQPPSNRLQAATTLPLQSLLDMHPQHVHHRHSMPSHPHPAHMQMQSSSSSHTSSHTPHSHPHHRTRTQPSLMHASTAKWTSMYDQHSPSSGEGSEKEGDVGNRMRSKGTKRQQNLEVNSAHEKLPRRSTLPTARRQSRSSSSDSSPSRMSASSSSSSLRSLAKKSSLSSSAAAAAVSSTESMRAIRANLGQLSTSALRDVESYIRRLAVKEAKQKMKRSSGSGGSNQSGMQEEGKRAWIREDDDGGAGGVSMSSDEDDDALGISGASRSTSHDSVNHPLAASSSSVSASSGSHSHHPPQHPHPHSQIPPSPGLGLPSLGMQRNWNAEFQACFTAICNDATILDNVAGYSALSSLAHDFLWTASTLGRIIISEQQLPEHQKSIPSIDVGGYAGGLKYIAHNILFKFAVDNPDALYGGDQFAAKAAGHELLGLSHYYRTVASSEGRLGLHVPLAALIDFRGYRLYAICKLPIDGTRTLVLGSMNGGQTILNSNEEMDRKMRTVASILNLKVHTVTDGSGNKTTIPGSCFDIEGHLGRDGKFYLVDFHRTFPPEPPAQVLAQYFNSQQQQQQAANNKTINSSASSPASRSGATSPIPTSVASTTSPISTSTNLLTLHTHQSTTQLKNTYLYRMLRPELIRSYPHPLSSDVYSMFDRDPENYYHVMECFKGLIERVIPLFARALEKNPPPQRFVDSGIQMQQQTANMIRTSSGGGNGNQEKQTQGGAATPSSSSISAPPTMQRSPSIPSLVNQLSGDPFIAPALSSNSSATTQYVCPPTLSLDVVSSVLHQSGINVRYLGLVRSHMRCSNWRQVFLVEILARLLKNELRSRWRAIRLKSMSDGPFRAAAVNFINLVFFPSLASNTYWSEYIHQQVNLHYPGTLQGDELDPKLFHLKASLQPASQLSNTSSTNGTQQTGTRRDSQAKYACPIHHPGHTHVGVDPADPLSFLPTLNTTGDILLNPNGAAAGTATPTNNTTANPQSPSTAPPTNTNDTAPPVTTSSISRSPSLPLISTPATLGGRSVSTSVGYVKQSPHLPSSLATAAAAGLHTPKKPHHHHAHSTGAAGQPTTAGASSSGAPVSSSSASSTTKKSRTTTLNDAPPHLNCPGLGCCGTSVDYLLMLFMRFVQLSGIILEDGIMEAISNAAEQQTREQEEEELGRQESATSSTSFEADDIVVGEGSLQMDRAFMRDRQVSSGGLPNPYPLQGRSVTEPRVGSAFAPLSPPSLQHTASTRDSGAYPPLPSARNSGHANSPANTTVTSAAASHTSAIGMTRNLSNSNLSTQSLSIVSPVHVNTTWRPISVPSTPQTPPSSSGRSTPRNEFDGFTRSRSGSFVSLTLNQPSGLANSSTSFASTSLPAGETWSLWSWPPACPFEEMHVRSLVEKVKQVNLLWYAEGTSLLIKSWEAVQRHQRWVAEQSNSSSSSGGVKENARDMPQGFAHNKSNSSSTAQSDAVTASTSMQKRFFLPGHFQSDSIFRDSPTPFLKMAFHLAGLAANKYQQALKYNLDDTLTLCNLSFLMSAVYNKYASAMSYLKRAVASNPMHVRSWYYIGQLYHYHLHDSNTARICYEKALTLSPEQAHANTLKDYGNLLQYQFNNPSEAALKYKKALEVEPRHIKSLQLLASLSTRTCDTLQDYDEIKKLLYNAARSTMGVVETRLSAQIKYLQFVICQAELYAEEYAYGLTHPGYHQAVATLSNQTVGEKVANEKSPDKAAPVPINNLLEATKRYREAIDFLQCPHLHYGSSRDIGAGENASATVVNQGTLSTALMKQQEASGTSGLTNLALTLPIHTAIQFMVSSTVLKPSLTASAAITSPSRKITEPARRGSITHDAASALPNVAESGSLAPNASSAASSATPTAATEAPTPAAGFSWCVCPDCCAVNFDALPLADTLLSYAQFIHQYEAVPPTTSSAQLTASSLIGSKLIEAEKYFQWSILVHHTLITSKKKHRQVQMRHEMYPAEYTATIGAGNTDAHISTGSSLYRPNSLTKTTSTNTYHAPYSSNAHEVLVSNGQLSHTAYAFVPPAVKTAYLQTAPFPTTQTNANTTAIAGGMSTSGSTYSYPAPTIAILPPVASASNASVLLDQCAPYLTPGWLASLGVSASFHVIVSKPNPVTPLPAQTAEAEAERRLKSMALSDRKQDVAGASGSPGGSILSAIGSPTSATPAAAANTSTPIARPTSSWTTQNKKWDDLPAVIPAIPKDKDKESSSSSGASSNKRTTSNPTNAISLNHIEKELQGAELSMEIDLEFDGMIERTCSCAVDHSFGESATSCSCAFPSPRYLMSYGYFLMRIGRMNHAAYVFQSALVIHPFGRTGSSCLARMIDCAVRNGILAAGPSYAAHVVLVYSLYRKAVGFDQWEGELVSAQSSSSGSSASRKNDQDSIANKHTFIASLTAATLFLTFLKKHGNACGPVTASVPALSPVAHVASSSGSSTPSAPVAASSAPATTSSAPSIGPLLRDADATQTRLIKMIEQIRADMASSAASVSKSVGVPRAGSTFTQALANSAHCKCRRPQRGKPCLCSNAILKGMMTKVQQMRARVEAGRKARDGELRHQDAATSLQQQQQQPHGRRNRGDKPSSSRARGNNNRGAFSSFVSISERTPTGSSVTADDDASTNNAQPSASSSSSSSTNAPMREGSGAWAQKVINSENQPKLRTTTLTKETSRESTGSKDGTTTSTLMKPGSGMHVNTNSTSAAHSGSSTPVVATPISRSPALASSNLTAANLATLPPLILFPSITLQQPQPPSSTTSSAASNTGTSAVALVNLTTGIPTPTPAATTAAAVLLLPPESRWKAPPTLGNNPPPPSTAAATTNHPPAQSATATNTQPPALTPTLNIASNIMLSGLPHSLSTPTSLGRFPLPPSTATLPHPSSSSSMPTSATTTFNTQPPTAFFSPPPQFSSIAAIGSSNSSSAASSPHHTTPQQMTPLHRVPSTSSSSSMQSFAFKQSTLGKKK